MVKIYDRVFLHRAMTNMADMLDFAINFLGLPGDDYIKMFVGSEICKRLENGELSLIVGMCGEELAGRVIEEATGVETEAYDEERFDRTPEHWCGWAAAYYQWLRGITYRELFCVTPLDDLLALYPALHEADLSKFADVLDERRKLRNPETNLKRIRTARGCSQSELASQSGVSLRSIQMYEQRRKDINKTQLSTAISLARTLGCRAEDLAENW